MLTTLPSHLDGSQTEHYLRFAIDVGVEHTKNVLELFWRDQCLHDNEAHYHTPFPACPFARMQQDHTHGLTIFFSPKRRRGWRMRFKCRKFGQSSKVT